MHSLLYYYNVVCEIIYVYHCRNAFIYKKLYSQAHISQQLSDMSNFNKRFSR